MSVRNAAFFGLGVAASLVAPAVMAGDAGDPPQTSSPTPGMHVFSVNMDDLPRERVPALPSVVAPPSSAVWQTQAEGLHLVTMAGKPLARTAAPSKTKPTVVRFAGRGEEKVTVFLASSWTPGAVMNPHLVALVQCNQSTGTLLPIRWERLGVGADNIVNLDIDDGWFDGKSCRFVTTAHATLHPKLVAALGDMPIVFGMRDDDSVTLLMPTDGRLLSDAMGGDVVQMSGAGTRVTLPLGRGGSAALVTPIAPSALSEWVTRIAHLTPAAPAPVPSGDLMVRVDIAETVTEPKPTMLVRVQSPPPANGPIPARRAARRTEGRHRVGLNR